MKIICLFLFVVCTIMCFDASAQNGQSGRISLATYHDKGVRETNLMKDSLALTTSQLAQVDTTNRNYFMRLALLEGQFTDSIRTQKMIQIRTSWKTVLQGILTNEQYTKYLNMLAAQESRMRARLNIQ